MTAPPRPLRPLESINGIQRARDGGGIESPQQHDQSRPAGAGPPASSDLPGKRATCSQCRIRKVRCDGRRDVCRNCERLSFECSFRQLSQQSSTGGQYVLKPPEPRRRTQACSQCHIKKTRCLGELPSCSNCTRRGRTCTYPRARKQGGGPAVVDGGDGRGSDNNSGSGSRASPHAAGPGAYGPPPPPPVAAAIDLLGSVVAAADGEASPEPETALRLVEDYFHHLYPLPSFAFLHQPTVVQRCRDGTMNGPLRLAICALTALQLHRSSLCHDLWAQHAEQAVLQQLGRPSIFHLQALLLTIHYRIESGDFPAAFMLAALAARTAVALRLNYERSELLPVAQEARRRLFWSLYLLDDFFCVGLREFELCPEETIHLQLPCDDDLFEAGQFSQTGLLQLDPSRGPDQLPVGLRGTFLRLASARRAIFRFIRRVGLGEEPPTSIADSIRRFEDYLQYLKTLLRPPDEYSVTGLTTSRRPAQYIMVHVSWHQCHCDLYRIFMEGYSEAAPAPALAHVHPRERARLRRRCLEHADAIVRVLADFVDHMPPSGSCHHHHHHHHHLERDAAVCAFEAARIVLFCSRVPPEAEECSSLSSPAAVSKSASEAAIVKARTCLHVITKYFPSSAPIQPMRKELERLISSYSVRLALQTKEATTTTTTLTMSEPDPPPPPPRVSSGVSRFANSRQRLSIQSLLLQSDFVDDSHEIAAVPLPTSSASSPPPPPPPPPPSAENGPRGANVVTRPAESSVSYCHSSSSSSSSSSSQATPTATATATTTTTTATHSTTTTTTTMTLSSSTGIGAWGDPTQQQQQSHTNADHVPPNSAVGAQDENEEQQHRGLTFNPWMGFSGTEDLFFGGMNDEY